MVKMTDAQRVLMEISANSKQISTSLSLQRCAIKSHAFKGDIGALKLHFDNKRVTLDNVSITKKARS